MQDDYTFGWEAEFETNVPALVTRLNAAGLCGSSEMHSYHCRCEYCTFENGFPFRAQTDSSCGGEVISDVMRDIDEAREYMEELQSIAVDVDAEPSLAAGSHVHVGLQQYAFYDPMRTEFLWSYLRWENVLAELVAPGRWPEIRANNIPARWQLRGFSPYDYLMYDYRAAADVVLGHPWATQRRRTANQQGFDPFWVEDNLAVDHPDAYERLRASVYGALMEQDRHGWLNLSTRDLRTMEFRLWNSTRVAWRMEMYARTSLLFVNPDAIGDLQQRGMAVDVDHLLSIARRHDPELERLLLRQVNAPKTFDAFSSLGGDLVPLSPTAVPTAPPPDYEFTPPERPITVEAEDPYAALVDDRCGEPSCTDCYPDYVERDLPRRSIDIDHLRDALRRDTEPRIREIGVELNESFALAT